ATGKTLPAFQGFLTTQGVTGFGLGQTALYHTSDGGRTWTKRGVLPIPPSAPPAASSAIPRFQASGGAVQAPSAHDVYVSTCNGQMISNSGCATTLFASHDGGRSFQVVQDRNCTQQMTVHMTSPTEGVLLDTGYTMCEGTPWSNVIYKTQNGFSVLTRTAVLPIDVSALSFSSTEDGWLAGFPLSCGNPDGPCPLAVAVTTNGGSSWTFLPEPSASPIAHAASAS
ncbi:MAG: hypothetical protein ACP5QO_16235, partial [Clostridia bacterium]